VPDIEALNAVAAADIQAVNGVAKADTQAINGVGIAASGASYWAVCLDDAQTSWAAHADIASESDWATNVWNTYGESGSVDTVDIAYGKDGSGNPIFATISNATGNNVWMDQNNDITDGSSWSRSSIASGAKRLSILWGNDVWVSVGKMGNEELDRSTDGGANWTAIDISGLTNISSTIDITALASDGGDNWMFGQAANLYFSSDNGASWAFLIQPEGTGKTIYDIVFTNNTWVVLYKGSGTQSRIITCPASTAANMDATSDWGTAQLLEGAVYIDQTGNDAGSTALNGNITKRMAAAGGRVVVLQQGLASNNMARTTAADVNGKTCTLENVIVHVPLAEGNANCIATDGTVWIIGGDGSDTGRDGGTLARSTNGGDSWALIVEGINNTTSTTVNGIAPNVYLPL
tara:strand:- start:29 stop:1243 length:1215 start_codon:yes stop_codon:yes gene_type:complete